MLRTLSLALLWVYSFSGTAETVLSAEDAIKSGYPLTAFSQFQAHPLYPYLQYRAYREHLQVTPTEQLVAFFQANPRAPYSGWLAENAFPMWLSAGNYRAITDSYSPEFADESIECEWRQALIAQGEQAQAEAGVADLWLTGDSIEPSCNFFLSQMIGKGVITQAMIGERFQLAMAENNLSLAQYLLRQLQGSQAAPASTWLSVRQNQLPAQSVLSIVDPQWRAAATADVLYRMAGQQPEMAASLALQANQNGLFALQPEASGKALSRVAAKLAQDDNPRAEQIFTMIPKGHHDDNAVFDVIAYELRLQRWSALIPLLSGMGEDGDKAEYQYWLGKSYEKTGDSASAHSHYQKAASQRDFFGFLAAEKLGQAYQFNDHPLLKNPALYDKVVNRPESYRVRIFRRMGEHGRATAEFQSLCRYLSKEELEQAALFASELNWPIQTIMTLSKTKSWDALAARFPTDYQAIVAEQARQTGLSPAQIYAIIRKESIFQPEIRSPAGALGLMQVMPATARQTARKYGIPYSSSYSLTEPATNIRIGSRYLRDQIREFGHLAYAAAAYNAGPGRVVRWKAEHPGLPLDEWIAQIPFYETRDYVKRVLEYQKVYEYRLGLSSTPFHGQGIRAW